MMYQTILLLAIVSAAVAFSPAGRVTMNKMSMKLYGPATELVGSDLEWPEFDPAGFTKTASPETLAWYRAAELKHGRVAMLAALGQITQYYFQLGDPVFNQGDKPFAALQQVLAERPLAAFQIILAIFAVEALGQFNQVKEGAAPGDLGFDPLGLKPSDPETWEKVQLRELKNGRLAMFAIAGQLFTEYTTGNGVLEAWKLGQISPF